MPDLICQELEIEMSGGANGITIQVNLIPMWQFYFRTTTS
ncbi:hypothetical protein BH23CHL5_BH23CHL5_22030 [soil metagenome]